MRLWRALPLLLVLLVGCPDPPAPTDGKPPTNGTADGSTDGAGDGTADGASDGATDGAKPVRLPAWEVIPESIKEDIYPSMHTVTEWPDPAGLVSLKDVEEARRPPPSRTLQLKQLVDALLNPSLHPKDFDEALAMDAHGNLHLRIGRSKTLGSACMDVAASDSPFPLFAVTLLDKADKVHNIKMLRAQVRRTVNEHLASELAQKENMLEGHPKVKGKQVAALAFLDRNGYGMQFPYLYAYANGEHLTLVFQEVPHMTEPGTPMPESGD